MNKLHPNLVWTFGGIFLVLIISSIITYFLRKKIGKKSLHEIKQRINSWWVMALIFMLAMIFSRSLSLAFFALISFLATKEYFSIIETRRADRRVLFWVYLAIPIQYYLIYIQWYGMFIIFIPVYMSLLLPIRMITIGETDGFIRSASAIQWGLMKTVFCLSHNAALLVIPAYENPNGGGAGLVLFLVVLTQFNDVAQFIWGKSFGKHKAVPKVSPGKTWEGLIGGVATTMTIAFFTAPYLTPFSGYKALIAGFIIGVGGFVGDVVMSAVKRDVGVKDSGSLLPGHGGILDRVDSLTYTAPLFFHFVYFYCGSRLEF